MEEKNPDQIKIDLDTATQEIIQESVENKEASEQIQHSGKDSTKRKAKAQEPETISIEEKFYDDEDDDVLVPPKKDVFKKLSGLDLNDTDESSHSGRRAFFTKKDDSSSEVDNLKIVPPSNDNEKSTDNTEPNASQNSIYSDSYEYTNRKQRKNMLDFVISVMYHLGKSTEYC